MLVCNPALKVLLLQPYFKNNNVSQDNKFFTKSGMRIFKLQKSCHWVFLKLHDKKIFFKLAIFTRPNEVYVSGKLKSR